MFIMGSGYINCNISKKTYSAFKGIVDDSLTEVTAEMLNGVTSISNYAFYQCANLTSAEIPSSVISVGYMAFYGCSSLTSVIMSNGVQYIGGSAFYDCSLLASVTVEATTPPTLENANAFANVDQNLIIYVPSESVETYKAAAGWSTYASKIQAIP